MHNKQANRHKGDQMPIISNKKIKNIEAILSALDGARLKTYVDKFSLFEENLDKHKRYVETLVKAMEVKVDESLKMYYETAKQLIENQGMFFDGSIKNLELKIENNLNSAINQAKDSAAAHRTALERSMSLLDEKTRELSKSTIDKVNEAVSSHDEEIESKTISYFEKLHQANQDFFSQTIKANDGFVKDFELALSNGKQSINQSVIKLENEISEKIHTIVNTEINGLIVDDIRKRGTDAILNDFNKSLRDLGDEDRDSIVLAIKAILNRGSKNPEDESERNPVIPLSEKDLRHKDYNKLKTCILSGVAPMIVGPAGSGKSLACDQIARELGLHFYVANRVQNSFELTGFVNAQGKYVTTQFYEAFTRGGLFLFDEVDASAPEALVTINNAIAQGYMAFPGHSHNIPMHKDFKLVAAGNTYGKGATSLYTGRNILDAATLDRFMIIDWGYDTNLENSVVNDKPLLNFCWALRKACVAANQDKNVIVSTRSIIALEKIISADNKKPTAFTLKELLTQKFFETVEKHDMDKIKSKFVNEPSNQYHQVCLQILSEFAS